MHNDRFDEIQIREAAYQLWLDDGQPHGRDTEHWLSAIALLGSVAPKAKPVRKAAVKPRAAVALPKNPKAVAKAKVAIKK